MDSNGSRDAGDNVSTGTKVLHKSGTVFYIQEKVRICCIVIWGQTYITPQSCKDVKEATVSLDKFSACH